MDPQTLSAYADVMLWLKERGLLDGLDGKATGEWIGDSVVSFLRTKGFIIRLSRTRRMWVIRLVKEKYYAEYQEYVTDVYVPILLVFRQDLAQAL